MAKQVSREVIDVSQEVGSPTPPLPGKARNSSVLAEV